MAQNIDNMQDFLESRDILARIKELEDDKERDEQDTEELQALKEFAEEASGCVADWEHGATLIRDSYFTDYAQELAEDIGAIDRRANWPLQHIDWDAAATELQTDYGSAEFDGITYWGHA